MRVALGSLLFLAFVVGSVSAGCGGRTPEPSPLQVVWEDGQDGFGHVWNGKQHRRTAKVTNVSGERLDQVVVRWEGMPAEAHWKYTFHQGASLAPGESLPLEVTFAPAEADLGEVAEGAALEVRATWEGAQVQTRVPLEGEGVPGRCDLPQVMDFGEAGLGQTIRRSFELRNLQDVPEIATVGPLHSAGQFTAADSPGTLELVPFEVRQVAFDFTPHSAGAFEAELFARAAADCPERRVKLVGKGAHRLLPPTQSFWSCGASPVGVERTSELTFNNPGPDPVTISALRVDDGQGFRLIHEEGQDPSSVTLAPHASFTVTVGCQPLSHGTNMGTLRYETDLPGLTEGTLMLTVQGQAVGPDIAVVPAETLGFGKVAYFPGANPPSFARRTLRVMNVGVAPPVPDPKENLRLGVQDANGNSHPPLFSLEPLNPETAVDEFTVTLPATYDSHKGLVAKAGENTLELQVTFTPISVGLKEAKLTLFSNDPDEPEYELTLRAEAVSIPGCDYSVTPGSLIFGMVDEGEYRDLSFRVTNHSSVTGETCLFSGLRLTPSSDAFFSLPQATPDTFQLDAGEYFDILVRVHPVGSPSVATNIIGTVELHASSPMNPLPTVSLSATIGPGCLSISPSPLDFGTVKPGCASGTRTLLVTNTCAAGFNINSFALVSAAGQPAGGPDCPGTQPCPEFHLVQAPAVPSGGLWLASGASFTAGMEYRPIDVGADHGGIGFNVTQAGKNVIYLHPLQGEGDPSAPTCPP